MSQRDVRTDFRLTAAFNMAGFVRSTDTVLLRPSSLRIVTVLSFHVLTLNGPEYEASSGRLMWSILSQAREEDQRCLRINDSCGP